MKAVSEGPSTKRPFTLLEILVGLALILLVAGTFSWRGHEMIAGKQFENDLALFCQTCQMCQRLAVTTQTDWQGNLRKEGTQWVFETICIDDHQMRPLKSVKLHATEIFFNQAPLLKGCTLQFFSTGKVIPEATFLFVQKDQRRELSLASLFHQSTSRSVK